MSVTIQLDGAQQAARELLELDDRLNQPLRPLLEVLGQQIASWAQSRIADSGRDLAGTEFEWPELHPATLAIRRRYGHQGKPVLYRGGQLQHDIRPLAQGADYTEVGATLDYAGTVQFGGETTRGGRRRTVLARPFLVLTDPQIDQLADLVALYLTDPLSDPEAARA